MPVGNIRSLKILNVLWSLWNFDESIHLPNFHTSRTAALLAVKKITRTWNYSDFILHSEKYITFLSELCTMELVPWSNLKDLQIFECKFWYWFLPLFRIIHLYKKKQVDVIDQRLNFCLIFMQNLKFNFRACYSERLSWRTVSVNAVLRLKKKLDLGPKIPYQALTPYIHKGH